MTVTLELKNMNKANKPVSNDVIRGTLNTKKTNLLLTIQSVDSDLTVVLSMVNDLVEKYTSRFKSIEQGMVYFPFPGTRVRKNRKGETVKNKDTNKPIIDVRPYCTNIFIRDEDDESIATKVVATPISGPPLHPTDNGKYFAVEIQYFAKFIEVNLDTLVNGKINPLAFDALRQNISHDLTVNEKRAMHDEYEAWVKEHNDWRTIYNGHKSDLTSKIDALSEDDKFMYYEYAKEAMLSEKALKTYNQNKPKVIGSHHIDFTRNKPRTKGSVVTKSIAFTPHTYRTCINQYRGYMKHHNLLDTYSRCEKARAHMNSYTALIQKADTDKTFSLAVDARPWTLKQNKNHIRRTVRRDIEKQLLQSSYGLLA